MTPRAKLAWYAVACLSALLAFIVWGRFGESILSADKTYITAAITAAYFIATGWIGINIHMGREAPVYWVRYLIGLFPALGLIGTLIGIAALFGLSGGTDDAATLSALGTALYTTLAGIICAEALTLQLKVLHA